MANECRKKLCMHGYYVYDIWEAAVGEMLFCVREPRNTHDRYAVTGGNYSWWQKFHGFNFHGWGDSRKFQHTKNFCAYGSFWPSRIAAKVERVACVRWQVCADFFKLLDIHDYCTQSTPPLPQIVRNLTRLQANQAVLMLNFCFFSHTQSFFSMICGFFQAFCCIKITILHNSILTVIN